MATEVTYERGCDRVISGDVANFISLCQPPKNKPKLRIRAATPAFVYKKRGRKPLSPNTKQRRLDEQKAKQKAKRQAMRDAKVAASSLPSSSSSSSASATTTVVENVANRTPSRRLKTKLVYVHINGNHPSSSPVPQAKSVKKSDFAAGFAPDFSKLIGDENCFNALITPKFVREVSTSQRSQVDSPHSLLHLDVPSSRKRLFDLPSNLPSNDLPSNLPVNEEVEQLKNQLKKALATIAHLQFDGKELVPGVPIEETQRGGSSVWYQHFRYRKSTETTWRCVKSQTLKCNAKLMCLDGEITVIGDHVHLANHAEEEVSKCKSRQIKRAKDAKEKRTATGTIYNEERNAMSEEAQQILPARKGAVKTLNRRRNDLYPKLPRDIDEFIEKMQGGDDELVAKYRKTSDGEHQFYHSSITCGDEKIVIFATQRDFYGLATAERWFFDGTFTVQPTNFQQRFSLHCSHPGTNQSQPVLYALLTSKSATIYKVLLKTIKEACINTLYLYNLSPTLKLKVITCDFESGFIPAIKETFGENVKFSGCHFHFSQCIYRHIQSSGLQKDNNNCKEFQCLVRKFMALAFLPLEEVKIKAEQMIADLPESLTGFGVYFQKTWIHGMPPAMWNVHNYV